MISLMPYNFLFFFVTLFGTTLSLSSSHWLGMWAGLELNLLGFIPLIVSRGMTLEAESAIKYFLVQALGSSILLLGSMTTFNLSLTWETVNSTHLWGLPFLIMSLLLKLGAFPFHFWLPPVMAGLSWPMNLVLTTWQKIAPLFLLSAIAQMWASPEKLMLLLIVAGMSGLIGGLGGINQTQIRAIMAYSSIGHIGWMILCMTISEMILKIYFLIYIVISAGLFLFLYASELSTLHQTLYMKTNKLKMFQMMMIFLLLSLGGLPPLLGFTGKWAAIHFMCSFTSPLPLLPLIVGSLLSLFYYLSLLFSLTLSSSSNLEPLFHRFTKPSYKNSPVMNLLITAPIISLNASGSILIFLTVPMTEFL
uniref:NADH-ubiquinone oxidoreductase chain 2 n=1 Tax=Lepetodrilus schrolli TaxID=205510 RepID=A0A0S1F5P1_9VEST|nr:NADH dehydrogenase subunit 2 [Lepetodrilus schrolli]